MRGTVVFERLPRDEYGFRLREAEWVWAQPTEAPLAEEYGFRLREAKWV